MRGLDAFRDHPTLSVDVWGRSIQDSSEWERARTLEEAGELTAKWLEGRLQTTP